MYVHLCAGTGDEWHAALKSHASPQAAGARPACPAEARTQAQRAAVVQRGAQLRGAALHPGQQLRLGVPSAKAAAAAAAGLAHALGGVLLSRPLGSVPLLLQPSAGRHT